MNSFNKRTFTLPLLARSLGGAGLYLPVMARALVKPRLSAAMREQIMLAVTSVNDCRYCNWVHTGLALENGVDLEALQQTLTGNLDHADQRDAVAILFSQHFADTLRQPSARAREKLDQHFSAAEQRELMAWIQAIYFANLTGNSADAVLARLRGRPVDGNFLVQALAALLGAPVLLSIWLNSQRQGKEKLEVL